MDAATNSKSFKLPGPPDTWAADQLTSFFDLTRHQQFATFVNMHPAFDKMRDVDAAFVAFHANLTDPEDLVVPFFSTFTHAAYRGAAGLAMSTQSALAFAAMRQCLENCLYGLYINKHPQSFETWIKRTESDAARQTMKAEFTIGNLRKTLETVDKDTCQLWSHLYEKSIDFGAHPNPSALIAALKKHEHEKGIQWNVAYLTTEPEVIGGTIKSVAQTGIVCLRVFRHVFPKRFDELGITQSIPRLQVGL